MRCEQEEKSASLLYSHRFEIHLPPVYGAFEKLFVLSHWVGLTRVITLETEKNYCLGGSCRFPTILFIGLFPGGNNICLPWKWEKTLLWQAVPMVHWSELMKLSPSPSVRSWGTRWKQADSTRSKIQWEKRERDRFIPVPVVFQKTNFIRMQRIIAPEEKSFYCIEHFVWVLQLGVWEHSLLLCDSGSQYALQFSISTV